MEKAAIYARVSTEDQAQHGISLDAQVNRCVEYVSVQNYDLVIPLLTLALVENPLTGLALNGSYHWYKRRKLIM